MFQCNSIYGLLIKTWSFKSWASKKSINTGNQDINARCDFGRMTDGDFIDEFRLKDLDISLGSVSHILIEVLYLK